MGLPSMSWEPPRSQARESWLQLPHQTAGQMMVDQRSIVTPCGNGPSLNLATGLLDLFNLIW